MIQRFIDFLEQSAPLSDSDRQLVRDLLPVKVFARGENLLEEGAISKAFYFNLQGLVRLFYLHSGEERTAWFYTEQDFVSAYSSFVRQEPSQFFLQAIEETHVVFISRESAAQLLQVSSRFEVLARLAMEEELIHLQDMVASLLTLKPEERYERLLRVRPELFQRVPQLHIASFLGVKPESLSRIKKRALDRS